MKIKVNLKEMLAALNTAGKAVLLPAVAPAMEGVHITASEDGKITILGTGGDMSVRATIDAVEVKVQEQGKILFRNMSKRNTTTKRRKSMAEHRIEVKISDSELKNLDKMTKKMKTSRSEVIRMLLSNSKVHEKTREDLHEFTRELSTLRFDIEALVQRIDNDEDAQDYLHKVVQEIRAVHNEIVEEYLC